MADDVSRQSSYEAIVDWTERQDLSGAAMTLCIANKMDKLVDGDRILRPAWLDKARQWCNSEMIEYIEVITGMQSNSWQIPHLTSDC